MALSKLAADCLRQNGGSMKMAHEAAKRQARNFRYRAWKMTLPIAANELYVKARDWEKAAKELEGGDGSSQPSMF